jgi:glycosyltransferase involved in cell wall biosynthesis
MQKLYIISNESIFTEKESFFCDNIDLKSTSEGLNKKFEVNLIAKQSKKKRFHKINLNKIKIHSNIISFLLSVFKSLKDKNVKYLIISISPFTFLANILLKIFKRKSSVYLRSDGFGQYKAILGFVGPIIYYFMFLITSKISSLISCRDYILRGRDGEIVTPSQLNNNWFLERKKAVLKPVKLLYVGRIRIEKGTYSLLELLKKKDNEFLLSIVGAENNHDKKILQKNINFFEIQNNEKKLIEIYDNHTIFILPSFTEGYPMVVLESLARLRPVIIFKDIGHIVEGKEGIFVAERNFESLSEKINYILSNYESIHKQMETNILATNNNFINQISKIIVKRA